MQICGEHRESKILSHGFFASPLAQDEDLIEVHGDVKGLKGVYAYLANKSVMIIIESKCCLLYMLLWYHK